MNLSPREKDKLLISMAAMVARRRLERGVKLNHPEAIALITDFVVKGASDGPSVADLMAAGAHVVTHAHVIEGVAEMITLFQVNGIMLYVDPDGNAQGYEDVFSKIAMCRAHYQACDLGAEYVDRFIR